MRKFLIITAFLTIWLMSPAQIANEAPDFTITDMNGNTVNLYETLDQGKTVAIMFFWVSCIHCYVEAPKVDSIWQQTGSGQDNVVVWGFEAGIGSPVDVQDFVNTTEIGFPVFCSQGQEPVHEYFDVTYTPRIFVICPNKIYTETGFDVMLETIDACELSHIDEYDNEPITIIMEHNGILFQNKHNQTHLELFDILGNRIMSYTMPAHTTKSISLAKKQQLYIINVHTNKQCFSKKIVY